MTKTGALRAEPIAHIVHLLQKNRNQGSRIFVP